MCSVIDEWPEFYKSSARVARKAHTCSECARVIEAGERYGVAFIIFEGALESFKTCSHCMVGQDWLNELCNGFLHGGLREQIYGHRDPMNHCDADLASFLRGMDAKWRNAAGELMPIPQISDSAYA